MEITSLMKTVAADKDRLSEFAVCPQEVQKFCEAHNLFSGVVAAVQLAERHFPAGSKITLVVESDFESDAEWLAVDVGVPAASGSPLPFYRKFIEEWSRSSDGNAKEFIHLTFCRI